MFRGGSLSTIKQEMHADYIKQALHAYDNGNQEEAAALFARAERHGALSEHHSNIYSECRK